MEINNNTTLLDYALLEIERLCGSNEKSSSFQESIIYLFTSQGIDNISYLDFEMKFPDKAHNLSKLIRFVSSKKGQEQISIMLEDRNHLENMIRNSKYYDNKNYDNYYYDSDNNSNSRYYKATMKF